MSGNTFMKQKIALYHRNILEKLHTRSLYCIVFKTVVWYLLFILDSVLSQLIFAVIASNF